MTDVKSTILARRARFLAAAVAGAGLTIGCSSSDVCLSMTPDRSDSGTEAGDGESDANGEFQVCLSVYKEAGSDEEAGPQPCLAPASDGG
jgi:hypothetical protein